MATSKKSSGGRSGGPSKAAASKGGRASGGGASKKSAGASKKSSGGARGAASKATAPKKAVASKSAAGSRAGGARGAAAGSKATAARGGRAGAATKATASRGATSKATASRGTAGARGGASTARGGSSTRGAASARGGAATASRGRAAASGGRGGASRATSARGKQQSTDPRNDLEKLLIDGLKDIYYAEKALSKTLARMGRSATNEELRAAFETHRGETDEQIRMLEGAFASLGQRVQGKKCHAMDGLIEEGKEHMEEASKGPGRDAVMIVSAQKAEHYEIAAYGSLRTFARDLGHTEVQQIFQTILDQESATDEKLTGIAETVNRMALRAHNDTEGSEGGQGGNSSGGSESGGSNSDNGDSRSDVAPIPAETLDITV